MSSITTDLGRPNLRDPFLRIGTHGTSFFSLSFFFFFFFFKNIYKDPNYTLKYMFVFLKHERSLRYTAVSGSGSGMGSGSNIVYIAVNKSSRREIKTSVIHVLLNLVSGTFGLECTNTNTAPPLHAA